MIRLALFLSGSIWAVMAFSPELDEPVFTESTPEPAPVMVAEVPAVATPVAAPAVITPVVAAMPVVEPAPVPVVETAPAPEVVAVPEPVVAEVVPAPEPEPERIIWFVTGSRVNVREGPSTDYSIMGKVIYGDAAEIVSDPDADWVKIRIEGDGVEGYIMKRFMTEVDPLG